MMKYKKYRPSKEEYDGFIEHLVEEISKKQPKTCFYIYGSYARGDYTVGRSDIDGGIILDSDVITNKTKVMELAKIIKEGLEQNRITPQINLLDRKTNQDGRFMSYTSDYTNYFKEQAKVLSGPNYIDEMHGLESKPSVLNRTAFNFRKIRNGLLYSLDNLETDDKKFVEDFEKSLDVVAGLPKNLVMMVDGKLIPDKFKSVERIKEIFPDVDYGTLEYVIYLLKNPEEIDDLFNDSQEVLRVWQGALTSFEELVKAFIDKYPLSQNTKNYSLKEEQSGGG